MGKYSELTNTEAVDISEPTAGDKAASANTTEPATHVNRMAEARAMTVQQIRALERLEGKFEGGAMSLTPKERLLDAKDSEAQNPGYGLRWLSLRNKEKMDARIEEGYERVPESEGGKALGDGMALFRIPLKLREARVKRQEAMTKERLGSVKEKYAEIGAQLVHQLKKTHGLSDSEVRRLIINE